jgi:hypothetical protein
LSLFWNAWFRTPSSSEVVFLPSGSLSIALIYLGSLIRGLVQKQHSLAPEWRSPHHSSTQSLDPKRPLSLLLIPRPCPDNKSMIKCTIKLTEIHFYSNHWLWEKWSVKSKSFHPAMTYRLGNIQKSVMWVSCKQIPTVRVHGCKWQKSDAVMQVNRHVIWVSCILAVRCLCYHATCELIFS